MTSPVDSPGGTRADADRLAASETLAGKPDAFRAGVLLAGRYRVVRRLAAGAMGEVYEAEDVALHERVALKRILEHAPGAPAVERFKREIQLARRVTHPNVCRIFDLGVHGEQLFLTMELLLGETLAERLRAGGPLGLAQAAPIARQLAAGLAAAHEAGVVHRDLKPANVMLVGERAVITDFGVARLGRTDESERLTGTGGLVGTPAYMAPEQLVGEAAGPPADIYALGLVLHEMVTGTLPWAGNAVRRVRERPPVPSGVLGSWAPAIARCLEPEPTARFPSASALARALETPPPPRRRWPLAAGALALAALAGAALVATRGGRPATPAARGHASVATLGFRNLSGRPEAAWLSTAVSEMLRTDLSAAGLRSVPGESIARMKAELSLADADTYASDTLERIGRNLATDYVLTGSYVAMGEQIRLDVRLQDVRTGELVEATSETGSADDLFAIVERTGARLRERLHAGPASDSAVRGSLPKSPEAARAYAEGLARLRAFDPQGASERLGQASQLEPDFPLAHAALAEAWVELGDETRAAAEAARALDLSAALPPEERLLVEARHHEVTHAWDDAAAAYRQLFAQAPDNLDYGLLLAGAESEAEHFGEAMATIAQLRRLPGADDNPRVDMAVAGASEDRVAAISALHAAQRKARARGAGLLEARALTQEAWNQAFLGEPEKGLVAAEAARPLYRRLGNPAGEWDVVNALGPIRATLGDTGAARAAFDEATALALAGGRMHAAATSLGNAVFVSLSVDDLAGARDRLAQLRPLVAELGAHESAVYLAQLEAWLLLEEGELAEAERRYQEPRALASATSPPSDQLIDALLDRGDSERAERLLADAEARHRQEHEGLRLADVKRRQAALALDRGRPAEAEAAARAALAERGDRGSVVLTRTVLARALAAQGKDEEARGALDDSRANAAGLPLPQRVAVATAELAVEGGPAVRERVQALVGEVHEAGVPRLELELRLALALEGHDGRALAALAADARARGFGRIAELAARGTR